MNSLRHRECTQLLMTHKGELRRLIIRPSQPTTAVAGEQVEERKANKQGLAIDGVDKFTKQTNIDDAALKDN